MTFPIAVLVGSVALLSVALSGAQPPAPTALIRDVAPGNGVLVVMGDGAVLTWGRSASVAIPVPTAVALPGRATRVADRAAP